MAVGELTVKAQHKFTPNNFKVSDFLSWQRAGTLDLSPEFQRRSVWRPGAKSYLIDTVHKSLPVPLVFLRDRLDLNTGETVREVVDGQQRLRTLLGFIDPLSIPDYEAERDAFVVSKTHNEVLAGKVFDELSADDRARILSYQLSVQTLPDDFDDRDVLGVFARLNSTGQSLNKQELRNAAYFGEFKTEMYRLAYEYFDCWQDWGIFNADQISRMLEVEMVSDLVYNILNGLSGKSQARLDRVYRQWDKAFEHRDEVAFQFGVVMDAIADKYGDKMRRSVFSREVQFFTLFVYTYDMMFDLTSTTFRMKPKPLPKAYAKGLTEASRRFKELEVPVEVLDAASRASADFGRRMTRYLYLKTVVAEL